LQSKIGMIPAKADPDIQSQFKKDQLEPRLFDTNKGERAVFFTDAANEVLAPYRWFLGSFARLFILAEAVLSRFNANAPALGREKKGVTRERHGMHSNAGALERGKKTIHTRPA